MAKTSYSRAEFLPLAMTSSIFIAVTVPYIIAISAKKIHIFLPYISHAAAFPPQSALLSIFMTIGALFGMLTIALRFVAVEHRRHRLEAKKIRILNRVSLAIGFLANLCMIFASHNPVGYVTHTKYDWFMNVVVPHFLGTGFLLTAFTFYVLLQSYLTYAQRKRSSMNVFVQATISMCVVITNWTTCLPFYAAMRDMAPSVIDEVTGEISLETQEYNFYYIISSLSEWAFTFFSLLFIVTFYRDLKNMNITITITLRPKLVKLDTVEPAPHTFNGGESLEITKM